MNATKTPYYIISDALCRAEIIAGATQLIGQIAVPLANARAALAELERAAAEPVAWCNPSEFASFVGKPRTGAQTHALDVFSQRGGRDTMPLYAAPPAPVAEIRDVVVTDEMCESVFRKYLHHGIQNSFSDTVANGRAMINVVRAELGPALGLVEIREPSDDECRDIWREAKANEGDGSKVCAGRAMFDAVREVLFK